MSGEGRDRGGAGMVAWSGPVFALLVLAHAAATSSFWRQTAEAFSGKSYRQLRVQRSFLGIDLDGIRARLDAAAPLDAAVALAPEVRSDEFVRQRFTEVFYPRRIDANASLVVTARSPGVPPPGAVVLGRLDAKELYLTGPIPAAGEPDAQAGGDPFRIAWAQLAAAVAGLCGLGFGVLLALHAATRRGGANSLDGLDLAASTALALPLGGLVVCLAATAATWLQIALPWFALTLCGLVPFFHVLITRHPPQVTRHSSPVTRHVSAAGRKASPFLVLLPALFSILLFIRLLRFPIAQWDGRSVWLFNAKRLFERGTLLAHEILDGSVGWSHPDYPLFLPSWLATFSALSPSFNERMAALGIAVLLGAALVLATFLLLELTGRRWAVALPLALAFNFDKTFAGGYADGFLALFLLIEFLAFAGARRWQLGWIAAAVASLLKTEGVVLAAGTAAVFALFSPHARGLDWRRRWLPFACFAPALFHQLRMAQLGAHSIAGGQDAAGTLTAFAPRLLEALAASGRLWTKQGYLHLRGVYWQLLLCLAATVAFRGLFGTAQNRVGGGRRAGAGFAADESSPKRRSPSPPGLLSQRAGEEEEIDVCDVGWAIRAALALAGLQTAFAYCSIALLPQKATWFVETALDRLLLHPAALLMLVPFLQARGEKG